MVTSMVVEENRFIHILVNMKESSPEYVATLTHAEGMGLPFSCLPKDKVS